MLVCGNGCACGKKVVAHIQLQTQEGSALHPVSQIPLHLQVATAGCFYAFFGVAFRPFDVGRHAANCLSDYSSSSAQDGSSAPPFSLLPCVPCIQNIRGHMCINVNASAHLQITANIDLHVR
eukprot:4343801-Pleurochrysis_carterae.AAC.9